jgi:hypothetical protein
VVLKKSTFDHHKPRPLRLVISEGATREAWSALVPGKVAAWVDVLLPIGRQGRSDPHRHYLPERSPTERCALWHLGLPSPKGAALAIQGAL